MVGRFLPFPQASLHRVPVPSKNEQSDPGGPGTNGRVTMSSTAKASPSSHPKSDSRYSSTDNLLDDDSIPATELQRVTCYRCNKLYEHPVLLPCLHAVCSRCYQVLAKEPKPTCPECQEEVKEIKQESPAIAKTDLVMTRAVADIQFHRKVVGKQESLCERCTLGKPSFAYCVVCSKFLCDHCCKDHSVSMDTRDHHVEKVADLKAKASKAGKAASLPARIPSTKGQKSSQTPAAPPHDSSHCNLHPGKELEFYCLNCQQLGCYKCIMGTHIKKGHEYVPVDDELHKKEKKSVDAEIAPLNETIKKYQDATATCEQRIAQLATNSGQVRQAIQDASDRLHQAVDARKYALLNQLDEMEKLKHKKMQEQLEGVKSQTQKLIKTRDIVVYALHNGNVYEVLQMKKPALARLEQLKTSYSGTDTLVLDESILLKFSEPEAREVDTLQDVIADFGHIADGAHAPNCSIQFPGKVKDGEKFKVQLTALDKFDRHCHNEKDAITALLRPDGGKAVRGKVAEVSHGVYQIVFEGRLVGKVFLTVTMAREQVKGSPFALEVDDSGGLKVTEGISLKVANEKKTVRFTPETKPSSVAEAKPPPVLAAAAAAGKQDSAKK